VQSSAPNLRSRANAAADDERLAQISFDARWQGSCRGMRMNTPAQSLKRAHVSTSIIVLTHEQAMESPVGRWMTSSPHSVGQDQPLAVAHAIMRKHRVRHLPVLDRGTLVGVVSQRDLYFLEAMDGVEQQLDTVDEGMSRNVYCVEPSTPLRQVVAEMAEHKYGCAIVLKDEKLAGIFTTTDALALLALGLAPAGKRGRKMLSSVVRCETIRG
jgi:acetoin utilization protein AcuB